MKQIGVDFQGWSVEMLTLREILDRLGFQEEDGKYFIKNDASILDAYSTLLEDDGMAYGVKPQYVTSADDEIYDTDVMVIKTSLIIEPEEGSKDRFGIKEEVNKETVKTFNLFRDVPEHKIDDDEVTV